jgi:adenylate kinase family enzyme
MRRLRLHITGASGAGATSLGLALAARLAMPFFDTDDFFWQPSDPPYLAERDDADRLRLMRELFLAGPAWILAGSVEGWGEALGAQFDGVIFLTLPDAVRIERLRARETARFGAAAVAPGGAWHKELEGFLDWASHYEDGTREGRSRGRHEAWLATLACPVLRLESRVPVAALAAKALELLVESGHR